MKQGDNVFDSVCVFALTADPFQTGEYVCILTIRMRVISF